MRLFSIYQKPSCRRIASCLLGGLALQAIVAMPCYAVISPFTSWTLSPDPGVGVVDNTSILTSYTTSAGTVSDLAPAGFGWGRFDLVNTTVPEVNNTWGAAGVEIDGVQSVLNLDVSTGLLNAGDISDSTQVDVAPNGTITFSNDTDPNSGAPFIVMFSREITGGLAGDGNDFFLVENGGNDPIIVAPVDNNGNPVGDFLLTIDVSDWGGFPDSFSRVTDNSGTPSTVDLAGIAFDIEDFVGTGTLTSMYGLAISGLPGAGVSNGVDLHVAGVNSALAPALPGDVNGDGFVNTTDFNIILGAMFTNVTSRFEGDLTGDFLVDFADYREWKDAPKTNPASGSGSNETIPEPANITLLVVALGIGSLARRQLAKCINS
jgi:hypothetical protein